MKQLLKYVLLSSLVICSIQSALSNPRIKVSGYTEVAWAYADIDSSVNFSNNLAGYEPYGFSLQKGSLCITAHATPKTKIVVANGIDTLRPYLQDCYLDHRFTSAFSLRAGRMKVPSSFENFSDSSYFSDSTQLFILRSHGAERWAQASYVTDGRAIGFLAHGTFFNNKLLYAIMAANPDSRSSFIPNQRSHTYQHYNNSIAGWGRIELRPFNGFGIGAFIGDGKGRRHTDSLLVKLITYGANIRYTAHNMFAVYDFTRAKTGLKYKPEYTISHVFMLGYQWRFLQPVFRYSVILPDGNSADSLGIKEYHSLVFGTNFKINNNWSIKANYCKRKEKNDHTSDRLLNDLYIVSVAAKF